jgi:hypothetical protein
MIIIPKEKDVFRAVKCKLKIDFAMLPHIYQSWNFLKVDGG